MKIEEIISRMPKLVAVIGEEWLHRERNWVGSFVIPRILWFKQIEKDLDILNRHLNTNKLVSCYRDSLRNKPQIARTIFEIHGAALLATIATRLDLHVPKGGGTERAFDIWAEIHGFSINAECKTRKDEFPFNLPLQSDNISEIPIYGGSRGTMDPHDASELGIEMKKPINASGHIVTPESTVIRQLLLEALEQLPSIGHNLIMFGHIEGDRYDLENALYGTEVIQQQINQVTKEITFSLRRAPTGAFDRGAAGELFKSLNGLIWVRLWPDGDALGRAYKFYQNPNSMPLPNEINESLNTVINRWATPSVVEETVE